MASADTAAATVAMIKMVGRALTIS
jgi:hypothetical protein